MLSTGWLKDDDRAPGLPKHHTERIRRIHGHPYQRKIIVLSNKLALRKLRLRGGLQKLFDDFFPGIGGFALRCSKEGVPI
jgi:hypothetical protein